MWLSASRHRETAAMFARHWRRHATLGAYTVAFTGEGAEQWQCAERLRAAIPHKKLRACRKATFCAATCSAIASSRQFAVRSKEARCRPIGSIVPDTEIKYCITKRYHRRWMVLSSSTPTPDGMQAFRDRTGVQAARGPDPVPAARGVSRQYDCQTAGRVTKGRRPHLVRSQERTHC